MWWVEVIVCGLWWLLMPQWWWFPSSSECRYTCAGHCYLKDRNCVSGHAMRRMLIWDNPPCASAAEHNYRSRQKQASLNRITVAFKTTSDDDPPVILDLNSPLVALSCLVFFSFSLWLPNRTRYCFCSCVIVYLFFLRESTSRDSAVLSAVEGLLLPFFCLES